MVQLTPRDDVRKAAGDILRRVDQLIKGGEIDHSVREIMRAKEIDPTNGYIHAYEERLAYLKQEHEKNIAREQTRKEAEEAARIRDAQFPRQLEEEQQKRKEELERQRDELKKQEERSKAEQERPPAKETRRSLSKSAASGAPDSLDVNGFRKPSSKGTTTPKQPIALQEEQRDPRTSSERQLQIDVPIRSDQKSTPGAETILVIDDDEQMLLLISQILTHHRYRVTSLTTSDEAYALLKDWKPQLILSDIDLKTSTMGGFSFYEKMRKMDHLREVPFMFLTGMTDEILIRKGKELGVDDYLTKPFSERNLIAAVKGKLKRFGLLTQQPP
jgi:CheY-like chemotaxis protein